MKRPIPEQIVAAVTVLAESLAQWCEEGRDGRLEQHEGAVLERVRQVLTQCGLVTIERPWSTCERCHHGWSVVETTLGVGSRQRTSAGLLGWLVRLGATTDYRETRLHH